MDGRAVNTGEAHYDGAEVGYAVAAVYDRRLRTVAAVHQRRLFFF